MRLGFGVSIELLEGRQFLSASPQLIAQPANSVQPQIASAMIDGFTPDQIQHAYGFDQVVFGTDEVVGDGSGQTIAIVDAYDHPRILSDLKVFNRQFGLPNPPSFKKVSQTGSTTLLPRVDASWAQEIALDVEWAHAIAPMANILLVEADSDSLSDLAAAVDYARKVPGVSVVSMSWGMYEFANQVAYDKRFSTPKGHIGVTFVAASGDDGAGRGATWPAASGNVLSVGGTSLTLNDSTGDYVSESAWRDSSGGTSRYEAAPAYQSEIQSGTRRLAPDVAYNANPNTGFAIYDSVLFEGDVGWQVFGGTSAGTPQWAALIAIANQGRILQGGKTLGGPTGTLPTLYSLYNDSTTYGESYHDITTGGGSRWRGRQATAKAGYDIVTGLGSPQAPRVIAALLGAKGGTAVVKVNPSAAASALPMATARAAVSRLEDVASVAAVQAGFSGAPIRNLISDVVMNTSITPAVRVGAVVGNSFAGLSRWRMIDAYAGLDAAQADASLDQLNQAVDSVVQAGESPLKTSSRETPSRSWRLLLFRREVTMRWRLPNILTEPGAMIAPIHQPTWVRRLGVALAAGVAMGASILHGRRQGCHRRSSQARRFSIFDL